MVALVHMEAFGGHPLPSGDILWGTKNIYFL